METKQVKIQNRANETTSNHERLNKLVLYQRNANKSFEEILRLEGELSKIVKGVNISHSGNLLSRLQAKFRGVKFLI